MYAIQRRQRWANKHIKDIRESAGATTHKKQQMLQTSSGFLSVLASVVSTVPQPIPHALANLDSKIVAESAVAEHENTL